MRKALKAITAIGALVAALAGPLSPSANALPFINGSLSISDGVIITQIPPSKTSVVSQLTTVTPGATGNTNGCVLVFAGCAATANTFAFNIPNPGGVTTDTVVVGATTFSFQLTSESNIVRNALSCVPGGANFLCTDSLTLHGTGTVTAAGFNDTGYLFDFTATGTCQSTTGGATPTCDVTGTATASWSDTFTASGAAPAPEPASLVILGSALLGFGLIRRRRQGN